MINDYQRIAHAIDFIRSHVSSQPTLVQVAEEVHLSEYHFQRLFSRWAGVTPKRYLQVLTLNRAKILLQQQKLSALDISYEVGLTSGSRLYDLFVHIEGVTPSEFRQKGEGLQIIYGYHHTPFGYAFLAKTSRGICQFDFVDSDAVEVPLHRLIQNWSKAEIVEDANQTAPILEALFSPAPRTAAPLSLWVRGTNFQLNVWRALLTLEHGSVASYRDIAQMIGSPKASRAVGSAIGANPVALIIPCHRVLRQSGELGGYKWGETRKHAILAREAAHFG